MHPGRASIKTPRTRRDREKRPARSQRWRVHQDFGDPLPTGHRMNACSSRSILTAAIRYGRGAVHETEVMDSLFIVTTTARIDTSCETNKNRPKSPVSNGEDPRRPRSSDLIGENVDQAQDGGHVEE